MKGRVKSLGADASKPGSNLLKIDETILTVIPVAAPAPPGSFDRAIRTEKMWPEAGQEFGRHKAVVIVSTLRAFSDFAGAMDAALCVTMTITALNDLMPVIGLYWHSSETLCSSASVREMGLALGRAELPIGIWLKMHLFRGEPEPQMGGKPPVGMLVIGLRPFVGRELELVPSHRDVMTTTNGAIDLATYLLKKGPVLKEGHTATIGNSKNVRISYGMSRYSPNVSVIQIEEAHGDGVKVRHG